MTRQIATSRTLHRVPPRARRGLAIATPLLGRAGELTAIAEAAKTARFVAVSGAAGIGKSRLAAELSADPRRLGASRTALVRTEPEEGWSQVAARAERALGVWPGGLGDALASQAIALIVDDAHLLGEQGRRAARLVMGRAAGRLIVFAREAWPAVGGAVARADLAMEGLDEASAWALWEHLEDHDPAGETAFERAMARSRGVPLGMFREHARARYGESAWEPSALPREARCALECLAVLGQPASPDALSELDPDAELNPQTVLAELISRHLVTPALAAAPGAAGSEPDGRITLPASLREAVLAAMSEERRRALERAAAEHLAGATESASTFAEPVDRLRFIARHYLAAGDVGEASRVVAAGWKRAVARGGAADVEALARELEQKGHDAPELFAARAAIASQQGRVGQALELAELGGCQSAAERVELARLRARAGSLEAAAESLSGLAGEGDPDTRGKAGALLAEIVLLRGDSAGARRVAGDAFQRDRASLGAVARAELHRVLAAVEERAGRWASARANLSRAANAALSEPVTGARIELARARCLTLEGRSREAEKALARCQATAAELGDEGLAADAQIVAATIAASRGEGAEAARVLEAQLHGRRALGDELGALEAEVGLAEVELSRGELGRAREHARACSASAAAQGLRAFALRADLVLAGADAEGLALESARETLDELADDKLDAAAAAEARRRSALAAAKAGEGDLEAHARTLRDDLDAALAETHFALARGRRQAAWEAGRRAQLAAERVRRSDDATEVAAVVARLSFARGDRDRAASRAHRALARARERGLPRAHATALLVSSALARDAGDADEATRLAREAASLARDAGLAALALAAARAADALRGGEGSADPEPCAGEARALNPLADSLLADLGLTMERPYRAVSASGESRRVADAGGGRLDVKSRSLVVDAVSEVVLRGGEMIAELKRRSLLKRLLFLFAKSPGRVFSKEAIVEAVWEVEYHPLRHDAALFTNIMRVRRLLGEDGGDILRVTEAGYALAPPDDFLYIETAQPASESG